MERCLIISDTHNQIKICNGIYKNSDPAANHKSDSYYVERNVEVQYSLDGGKKAYGNALP